VRDDAIFELKSYLSVVSLDIEHLNDFRWMMAESFSLSNVRAT
jgi:hypothetical protein